MSTATGIQVTFPRDGGRRGVQWDVSELKDEEKVPPPK